MNPETLEWDYFGNTLYCHATLALFINVYEIFPFDYILRRTLSFLHAISHSVPNRFRNFLEQYIDQDIMRLKNLTTKDRAYLITLRCMGNYFLDEEFCQKRTLLDA